MFHQRNVLICRGPPTCRIPTPRGPLIEALRQQLGKWGAAAIEETPAFSCGAEAVDRLLPGGGLRQGMLVEWVGLAAGGSPAEESTTQRRSNKISASDRQAACRYMRGRHPEFARCLRGMSRGGPAW